MNNPSSVVSQVNQAAAEHDDRAELKATGAKAAE
jgi:hypothetical protein